MWQREKKFAVVLTCADWRLHHPRARLYRQLSRALGVHGLFMDAIPGPDGLLGPGRETEWAAVVRWTRLLADTRTPRALAVAAHQNCIAHAVSNEQHEVDVSRVADALKHETGFAGPVAAFVAVHHNEAKWSLKRIAEY